MTGPAQAPPGPGAAVAAGWLKRLGRVPAEWPPRLFLLPLGALGLALFFSSAALAQKAGCVQMLSEIICPPPNGGVSAGIDGQVVCGPGECARDSTGRVKCSALPGGSAIVNINGVILCVGGCVDGDRGYCVKPEK